VVMAVVVGGGRRGKCDGKGEKCGADVLRDTIFWISCSDILMVSLLVVRLLKGLESHGELGRREYVGYLGILSASRLVKPT